jgi:hypothetical protein
MGYSSMDKKPFETLELVRDGEKEVLEYLNLPENKESLQIVIKTKDFLKGYYSNFALELLSTVDYLNKKFLSSDKAISFSSNELTNSALVKSFKIFFW